MPQPCRARVRTRETNEAQSVGEPHQMPKQDELPPLHARVGARAVSRRPMLPYPVSGRRSKIASRHSSGRINGASNGHLKCTGLAGID
jgi:hypothetical protein